MDLIDRWYGFTSSAVVFPPRAVSLDSFCVEEDRCWGWKEQMGLGGVCSGYSAKSGGSRIIPPQLWAAVGGGRLCLQMDGTSY